MNIKTIIVLIFLVATLILPGCKTRNEKSKPAPKPSSTELNSEKPGPGVSAYQAALDGDLSQVSMQIDNGFNVNAPDEEGRTALMYAAFNGHTAVLKKLLEKGASINLRDPNGRTALMMAASGPYPDAVRLLLENSADPNLTDREEHFTALMFAAAEGQLEIVKILISNRADPLLKDIDGDDAYSFALNNGHKEVATLLLPFRK
jgi:ankyrin repeat protein